MIIQEHLPQSAVELSQIGIHVQQASKQSPVSSPVNDLEHPREEVNLSGLQLQDFDQAYVIHADGEANSFPLDPKLLQKSRLLDSLKQVHKQTNLETALKVNTHANELISAMRKAHGFNQETTVKIIITGVFGNLELDLKKLRPEALRQAFDDNMLQHNQNTLQVNHSNLATLAQRVRAGFGTSRQASQEWASEWLQLIQDPRLNLEELLAMALGFNPLNEEEAVRALLHELSDSSKSATPKISLSEAVTTLIELANQLEQELDLAPIPNTVSVIELLREFLAIIQQLDQDIYAIIQEQSRHQKLERKSLAFYAEQLHRNLHFHQEELNQLQQSGHDKLILLIHQAIVHTQARSGLALDNPVAQEMHGSLKEAYRLLNTRSQVQGPKD